MHHNALDITGQQFGRLTALRPTSERKSREVVWECLCECGEAARVITNKLTSGWTQSCGCLQREKAANTAIDLKGQWFGRLFPFRPTDERMGSHVIWDCLCECGTISRVNSASLKNGHTLSCGCLQKEAITTHGDVAGGHVPRLYGIWAGIKQRCNNSNSTGYKYYGGRGITYCDGWEDYVTFRDWALENGYDDILCIDRIDNDGNYEPNNCQFITNEENVRKRKWQ